MVDSSNPGQYGQSGESIKLYLNWCWFKALSPNLSLVSQIPGLLEHNLWYGFWILGPRTNALKLFTDGDSCMFNGKLFHNLVVDGKYEFDDFCSLVYLGLIWIGFLKL